MRMDEAVAEQGGSTEVLSDGKIRLVEQGRDGHKYSADCATDGALLE